MRNIAIIIGLCFITLTLSAQKLITTINTPNNVSGYSFKYDRKSGNYIYNDYDTTKQKNVLITSKGNSAEYDFEMSYSSIFDKSGNSYTVVYNKVQDTLYKYFLLKNNSEIASYDFIGDGWDISGDILYFYVKDNGKYCFIGYNTSSGELSKGKAYDEILLANFIDEYYEGEPQGRVGFTNDGKPYYLAVHNNEKFFVIGTDEQKHYADIDWYMTKKDNNGDLVYFAKSQGVFYYTRGNAFLVQGTKEYKQFDYVSGPVIFDKNNTPIYIATDSVKEYDGRSRVMVGNKEGKAYMGYIYEFKITPSGKLAYVVSKTSGYVKGEDAVTEYFMVIDGTEQKHYPFISNVTFNDWEVPVFTASNKKNKYFVVKGDKVISEKYDNIYDYLLMSDGSLAYIGNNFGNYEKQIPDKNYVHIEGKKFGPYDYVSMADYTKGKYILCDEKNNYAFVVSKLINPGDYIYKYSLLTNKWTSGEYNGIDFVKMANGKTVFVGTSVVDRVNYRNKYAVYIDNKRVSEEYDTMTDMIYDKSTGKISFIAGKGNDFYLLEFSM